VLAFIRCRNFAFRFEITKHKLRFIQICNFAVSWYGFEALSLKLREERRLTLFENRVLRRIFGFERDGVTGDWRKLHNDELNDLDTSQNIVRVIKSRRIRWAGHVARME
jgi:hypothetical protein